MRSTIEAILERQARLWEVGQRLAREDESAARRALVHLDRGPWLALSRQLGSGGRELANSLAQALDWQVFDQQIVDGIAEHTGTRAVVFERLDERAIGKFDDFLRQLINPGHPGQFDYLERMMRVVFGLATQGRAIILGRGANWFLDPRYGLRVRLVAPLDRRAERLAAREGLSPAEARRCVAARDAEQRAFVRQVFDREIDDPQGYDLLLNVDAFQPLQLSDVVLAALRLKLG